MAVAAAARRADGDENDVAGPDRLAQIGGEGEPPQLKVLFGPFAKDTNVMRGTIGCGTFACVWPRGRKKAVKITNDETDVLAMIRARNARIKGVPKLYNAFRMASPSTSEEPVYAMVVERLHTNVAALEKVYCIKDMAGMASTSEFADQCCAPEMYHPKTPLRSRADQRENEEFMCRRMAEDIPPTIEALEEIGIDMMDLHEENIGVNAANRWKILDLGVSGQMPTGKVAPTLQGPPLLRGLRRLRRRR